MSKYISKELSDEDLDSLLESYNLLVGVDDKDNLWTKDELIKALDSLSDLEEDIKGFERH